MRKLIYFSTCTLFFSIISCKMETKDAETSMDETTMRNDTGNRLAYEQGQRATEEGSPEIRDLNREETADDQDKTTTTSPRIPETGERSEKRESGNEGDMRNPERDNSKLRSQHTEAQKGNKPLPLNDDEKFLTDAAHDGMMEVLLAKHAQTRAIDKDVKEFAGIMLKDHAKVNQEILDMAAGMNLRLKTDLSEEAKKITRKWEGKQGRNYDLAFMEQMLNDHKKAVEMFREARQKTTNSQIGRFIDKTLPTLENHLAKAEKIHGKLSPVGVTMKK